MSTYNDTKWEHDRTKELIKKGLIIVYGDHMRMYLEKYMLTMGINYNVEEKRTRPEEMEEFIFTIRRKEND